jgi:hypothetical protein
MSKIKKGIGFSKVRPAKGDVYLFTTDIELRDVNDDGIVDLIVSHEVKKNGQQFTTGSVVWYGLDTETIAGFEAALDDAGIQDGTLELSSLKEVVKEWRKFTKFLKSINDFGDNIADALV